MRDLQVNIIEMDEQWAFIQKKAKRVKPGDSPDFGDRYVFVALAKRTQLRRFTRLTNAFSKKLASHPAAITLQFAHDNVCRWHEAIRCTPAMALGVTDHIWSIGELVDAALSATEPTPLPTPTRPRGMSASEAKGGQTAVQPKRLYVTTGGKGGRK